MTYADTTVIEHLAQSRNYRGWRTPDLVCEADNMRGQYEDIAACPFILEAETPTGCTQEEYIDDSLFYLRASIESILKEINRRETMQLSNVILGKSIIEAIKEKTGEQGLIDAISWYCQIETHHNIWKFKCTVHGDGHDRDASGVIYLKEIRWHCYGCNKGGDIFDAVMHFEHVPMSEAIKKLARYTGIDTRPFQPKPIPQAQGGVIV